MIDLASIQQQLAQPETPFDRAMSDPLFNIGLAMMSSPNIGTALQQGLKTTQSMKSNRLQNQLRLLELQAQMQPESAKPTALMRHMEIAQDPNNPLAQMMQKYLFKPTGSNVTIKMPGPVQQGFEKIPGYLGMAKEEGAYYIQNPETGQPEIRRIPGTKTTEAERRAAAFASRMEAAGEGIDDLPPVGSGLSDWYSLAVRSMEPGTLTQALAAAPLDASEKKRLALETNWIGANVRDESGTAVPPHEYPRVRAQYFELPTDTPEVKAQKRALRKQTEQANRGRAGAAPVAPPVIPDVSPPAPVPQAQSAPANLSPWAQRVLSAGEAQ